MNHPSPIPLSEATALTAAVLDAVETAVVGKRSSLEMVLTGILAGGHVLLEDLPGLGKTLAARSFAQALGLPFTRAQFTPDLLPADLTGAEVFDQRTGEFVFRPGPVFTGLLLADEINRTPPKTQSALLEAMQERQVSVEGTTRKLPQPFHVLATANPVEHEGTYPLPEAQLDRFLLRLSFGYPTAEQEWDVVARRIDRRREEQVVPEVLDAEGLLAVQSAVEDVHVEDSVGHYAVELVAATREHQHSLVGASPRGTLALITCARALAVIRGRSYVVPEDVKALAHPALDHRVTVKPELWLQNATGAGVVESVLGQVAVPAAAEPAGQATAGHPA
ncbi:MULTISPECIES: AAA family ATPase [Brachybacterium]|uniref:ATPase n=1 Tax=Brachybacterium alimentarium TaxID=47845 RepID=A0A2A3YLF6_9MICO|nr:MULTISPECIES: MoxR family ATPase [Brachybacterium]PCC34741.1 ATPase [Brachybacterium alimentarium]PCC40121.1 ATPase [Brachybacterium alimentarium]RCS63603.1 MoxR family ATPase [Brachybacterium sp. JB7]RCS71385.1 MoxR family ATPase [Brachybacterium alimentarium]RCS80617.1 MoxR family ATPase [Brachybacterium alimentarium]